MYAVAPGLVVVTLGGLLSSGCGRSSIGRSGPTGGHAGSIASGGQWDGEGGAASGSSDGLENQSAHGGALPSGGASAGLGGAGGGNGGAEALGTCGPRPSSSPDCETLAASVQDAIRVFVPKSSVACSSDYDCTTVATAVYRNGQVCRAGCKMAATVDYAAEWSAFLASDHNVAMACDAFLQAGCCAGYLGCPCLAPDGCGASHCINSVCQ